MDAHAAHDIRSHVKTYYMIFGALMLLTCITVAVSYFHLPIPMAITVALIVATIKGSLVALFFMHLSDERRLIYRALRMKLGRLTGNFAGSERLARSSNFTLTATSAVGQGAGRCRFRQSRWGLRARLRTACIAKQRAPLSN